MRNHSTWLCLKFGPQGNSAREATPRLSIRQRASHPCVTGGRPKAPRDVRKRTDTCYAARRRTTTKSRVDHLRPRPPFDADGLDGIRDPLVSGRAWLSLESAVEASKNVTSYGMAALKHDIRGIEQRGPRNVVDF